MDRFCYDQATLQPFPFPRRYCGDGASPNADVGCSSFMYGGPELEPIRRKAGRKDAWAKIFYSPLTGPLAEYAWKGTHSEAHASSSLLWESTVIQNIAALYGLAPRVYGIFPVMLQGQDTVHPVQLCKYVAQRMSATDEARRLSTYNALSDLGGRLGYMPFGDLKSSNCRSGNQWVDFQGWHLASDYEERLAQRVQDLGRFQGPKGSYQSVSELGWEGRRDSASRVEQLGLNRIDFAGRTVLDVGCSVGAFCRYALDQGATRVVGVDWPKPIQAAAEVSAYLGYHNIDYLALDLCRARDTDIVEQTDIEQFDIVLFLAMRKHIGFPDWVSQMCRQVLVLETHPHPRLQMGAIRAELESGFEAVVHIGKSGDQYPRKVFWAIKENGGT